jgi:two-component system nitrogen regulation response regulator NtrX
MSRKALDQLCDYSWPGNVRELKNLIERLAIMVEKDVIEKSDIPDYKNLQAQDITDPLEEILSIKFLKDAKKAFEKEFIQRKLLQENNNIAKTARAINVGRSYLYKKLKEF